MTQMEIIDRNIEHYRCNLQNLINRKNSLSDFEIVEASQNLDKQLNIYQYAMEEHDNYYD